MTAHDDEILGKAYDARLMRRLLHYLRPYWRQVAVALATIVVGGAASLAQPYLIKIAIDRYIALGRLDGFDRLALLFLAVLVVAFVSEFVQTWAMQFTGQRIMFDLRMDFVGDFSVLPTRVDLHGTYAKKKFIARYYQADKLRGILLCQQTPREVEAAKDQLRQAQGK